MFSSPFPDVDIPDVSVYDYLFGSLDDNDRARIALVDGTTGAQTDYGTLAAQIDAVAGYLAAHGVRPGDVVGLFAPNIPAFAAVFPWDPPRRRCRHHHQRSLHRRRGGAPARGRRGRLALHDLAVPGTRRKPPRPIRAFPRSASWSWTEPRDTPPSRTC